MRILVLIALASCALPAAESSPGSGPPAALVAVSTAERGGLSDRWTVPGDVRALDHADLAAGATGPVVSLDVREGDRVVDGQRLLQVDPAPASARAASVAAQADETGASLERARRDLARLERVASEVLSEAEIDAARSLVAELEARQRAQQAAAREARVTLGRHAVTAPFAGVVSERLVDRGDWVTVGQPVLKVVRTDQVDIRVDAALELARQVQTGDAVALGAVSGTVAAVVPALDPSTRTAVIRLVPDGTAHGLVPGSTVQVGFAVEREASDGALVPRDALVLGPVDTKVVRVVEGAADVVTVDVLATSAERALVTRIQPGDVVVVRGGERLRPGQALTTGEASP